MGLTKSIIPEEPVVSEGKAAVLDQNALDVAPASSETSGVNAASAEAAVRSAVVKEKPKAVPANDGELDIGELYVTHRNLLLYIACRKFRIPEADAENLIQEVFVSFLQTGTKVENVRAWLVAAMCNASRHFWRAAGRTESLPDDIGERSDPHSHGNADRFAMQMTLWQAVQYLQPRCRDTIYLHYFEGRSAVEVARELETTNRYAEKLIHNCLSRLREIYKSITAVRR